MNEIKNEDIKNILFKVSKNIILPKFKKLSDDDIRYKNNIDLVTSVDIDVENYLKESLLKILPNSLFVGEESFFENPKIIESYKEAKFCWTVDPIDGTRNFVKGSSKFAIMVALTFKEKIFQSWIYKPIDDEFTFAKLGSGTYIDDKKLFNNLKKKKFSDSVGSISSKYWTDNYVNKINYIKEQFLNISSLGCIGHEYIDIAKGKRDFTILSRLYPWDHIPGVLIVSESGGSTLHFDKTKYNHSINKDNIVVSNSNLLTKKIINLIEE